MARNLIYQIYPISWIDPEYEGDNRSALKKVIDFLPILKSLNVDYLWLSPIYSSPWCDHGYDVADYYTIDPRFGTMQEFETLVELADQGYGIKIMMDLVINHTSTSHKWFKNKPEYYCWSKTDHPGWHNLFDDGPAWTYLEETGEYYLHLFHQNQADLNWFPDGPDGRLNRELVEEFKQIVDFWCMKGVAGFRLDAAQVINKNVMNNHFDPFETATKYVGMASRVINAIFWVRRYPFLLIECLDLTGQMARDYYNYTVVDAIMDNTPINALGITADQLVANRKLEDFFKRITKNVANCPKGYAHVTESHDGPRFASATGVSSEEAIDILFGVYHGQNICDPETIVMYQGQELGLKNPNQNELPDEKMLALDAETAMRHVRGESLDDLRPNSCANTRVPLPIEEYDRQRVNPKSPFIYTRNWSTIWHNREKWCIEPPNFDI